MNKLLAAVSALAVSTAQADIYVDAANCPGPGNGTIEDPYCSIQAALNFGAGPVILVAPGTYGPINFNKLNFVVRSTDGPQVTIIDGGGLPAVKCVNGESDMTLDGFTITGGQAAHPGGGGMIAWDCGATVMNCIFTGNTAIAANAGNGGGLYCLYSGVTVVNCVFTDNLALSGGGLSVEDSFVEVIDCTFDGNTAFNGGGITHEAGGFGSGTLHVTDCRFIDNTVFEDGGGMACIDGLTTTITGCLFTGNTADGSGGGLGIFGSATPTVTNCTFALNTAAGIGGGMLDFALQGGADVSNSVSWLNTPPSVLVFSVITYSSFDNFPAGITNINEYAMFVDPANGDFRLLPGSPCIDSGSNDVVPADLTTDLDGNPRFLEIPETQDCPQLPGSCGDLPVVDMGAYESLGGGCLAVTSQEIVCHADGTTFTVNVEGLNACTGGTTQVTFTASGGSVGEELCFTALVSDGGFCCSTKICVTIPDCTPAALPSDLDGDGIVGMVDFLALLGAWGPCSDCGTCQADFDGDCSVGILDLLILLGNWG